MSLHYFNIAIFNRNFIYCRTAIRFKSFDLKANICSVSLLSFPVYWDGLILPIFLVKSISPTLFNVAIFDRVFIYLRVMIDFRSFDLKYVFWPKNRYYVRHYYRLSQYNGTGQFFLWIYFFTCFDILIFDLIYILSGGIWF